MKTTLDKFGRVVIPKALRDELGMKAGAELQVEGAEEGILLRPLREESHVRLKEGVLVFTAGADGDLRAAVEAQRIERIRQVAFWKRG